jgi:predicted nuclease with TOPRIM domain
LINLVCQAALVYGFSDEAKVISQDIIHQISEDNIVMGLEPNEGEEALLPAHAKSVSDTMAYEAVVNKIKDEVSELKNTVKKLMKKYEAQKKAQLDNRIERLELKLKQEKSRYAELFHYYAVLKQKFKSLEQEKEKKQRFFLRGKK